MLSSIMYLSVYTPASTNLSYRRRILVQANRASKFPIIFLYVQLWRTISKIGYVYFTDM